MEVESGTVSAQARLNETKQTQGIAFGTCLLTEMKGADLENLARTATCHQNLLGIIKKDFFQGMYKLLGKSLGTAWLRRIDARRALCTRQTELQRPLKAYFPSAATSATKPLSGWICEDVWNCVETTGLLTMSAAFGPSERGLLAAGLGRNPDNEIVAAVGNLDACSRIWWRLNSAILFSLRTWSTQTCTQDLEDRFPGTLERVNQLIRESRDNYKADIFIAFTLMEIHFPKSSLSSNGHTAVCRGTHELETLGAHLPELGIERTVLQLPANLPACLPACLSACLPACLSVCLSACPPCLLACLTACLPACLPVCLTACLPA